MWQYSEVRNFMFSSTSLFNCRLLSAHGSSEYTAAAASRHTTTLQTRRAEPQTLRIHWHDHTLEHVSKYECKVVLLLQKGNSIEGEYHDMMFLTNPMVNMSLVVEAGVQFSPPLDQTKEIMINCLKEIVENTQNFPRIEKEIFPEYKEEDIFLLDVTWEEDYVQQLGERIFIRAANDSSDFSTIFHTFLWPSLDKMHFVTK